MIILDTSALVAWAIADPDDEIAARLAALFERAEVDAVGVGIPAPVFAEFLVRTDEATTAMLATIERKRGLSVLPFDKRAAHECALLDRAALAAGAKRAGGTQHWQKVKIDRQIVAIARVHNCQLLVTSDRDLAAWARRVGVRVSSVDELPLPDEAKQRRLPLAQPDDSQEAPAPDGAPSAPTGL